MQDSKPDIKPGPSSEPYNRPGQVEEEELVVESTFDATNVWSLKIPKFLLEQWERVTEEGVELGTLIVDNNYQPPRISMKLSDTTVPLPDDPMNGEAGPSRAGPSKRPRYDTSEIPDEYEVRVPEGRAKNMYTFSEKKRTWGSMAQGVSDIGKFGKQKAHPKLLGRVAHECTVRPTKNDKYLRILQQRQVDSQASRRPIVQLESTGISRGLQNQLASGVHNVNSDFGKGFVRQEVRGLAGERFERMERPELTEKLFNLFSEKPYWSITALRQNVRQPDMWMREVLKDVAEPVKEGPYINLWRLKDVWKDANGDVDDSKLGIKEDEEFNDDEDDDVDLEEVMAS